MNYLLEIVIFNVVIFTISGIIMAKKGKLGMIQEYPKAIQDRCRELGLIQESSAKLTKKATIGKLGLFIGYIFLQTVLAYYIGGARTFFEGWFHGYIMWVAEIWFDALVVDCLWLYDLANGVGVLYWWCPNLCGGLAAGIHYVDSRDVV